MYWIKVTRIPFSLPYFRCFWLAHNGKWKRKKDIIIYSWSWFPLNKINITKRERGQPFLKEIQKDKVFFFIFFSSRFNNVTFIIKKPFFFFRFISLSSTVFFLSCYISLRRKYKIPNKLFIRCVAVFDFD